MKNNYLRFFVLVITLTGGMLVMGQSRADSIRNFLIEFGEKEQYITPIVDHCDEYSFDSVYHIYIDERVLHYDEHQDKMVNVLSGWGPHSHAIFYNASYIRNHMSEDVKGELIRLFTRLVMQGTPHDSIINYAEYYWYNHHIPQALIIELCYWAEWKYSHKVDLPRSEAAYLYYCMATYVLCQGRNYKYFCYYHGLDFKPRYRKLYAGEMIPYDKKWIRDFNKNHQHPSQLAKQSYYSQFRAIHLYDDRDSPFVLTEATRENIREVLDKGIQANERECIITKAFALITGTCLERDIEQGKQLLISVWPKMEGSHFWDYVSEMN